MNLVKLQDAKLIHRNLLHCDSGGFPVGPSGKESAYQCCRCKKHGFDPWWERSPSGGKWQPLQYSCLKISTDKRSLVGYSPWGHKELDTTE